MRDLNRYVRPSIATKWYNVGLQLLDDKSTLDTIVEWNSPVDVEKCAAAMFRLWLERTPDASWNQLIEALRVINLYSLASKIEGMLSKGMSICNAYISMYD